MCRSLGKKARKAAAKKTTAKLSQEVAGHIDEYEGGASGQLVLRLHASASEVLLADEDSVAGAVSWREGFALSPGALLQFERFFDFRAWNDPCELKYVQCRLLDEKGQRLLVPTSAADFYYRATPT